MKLLILICLLSTQLYANSEKHAHGHDQHQIAEKRTKLTSEARAEFDAVLRQNDSLYQELLKDKPQSLEKNAKALHELIVGSKGAWTANLKQSSQKLLSIKNDQQKQANLAQYQDFLPSLIELVRKYEGAKEFNIYYCPMVKQYWLQNSQTTPTIKNVFAQEMLECGSKQTNF